jgi:hypothetical protein
LFITGGLILAIAGFFLLRKFNPPDQNQPRFRPAGPPLNGLMAFLGLLMLIFGLSAMMVGAMVALF